MNWRLMVVVVSGNPFDGLRIHGPFPEAEVANEWASEELQGEEWWTVEVQQPSISKG